MFTLTACFNRVVAARQDVIVAAMRCSTEITSLTPKEEFECYLQELDKLMLHLKCAIRDLNDVMQG